MIWSAARIMASSCSTTTTVLPRSRSAVTAVDQPIDVGRMQADRRLVEHVEHVHQARAERRRQRDALRFAAAERAQRAIERQIAEPDGFQIAQPRLHLFEHHPADAALPIG